jgi:hypothetical protein
MSLAGSGDQICEQDDIVRCDCPEGGDYCRQHQFCAFSRYALGRLNCFFGLFRAVQDRE